MTFIKTKPKFKVGDIVELVGVYRKKYPAKNSGKVLSLFTDPEQIKIGASFHGCVVDGLGAYGEGALRLKEQKLLLKFLTFFEKKLGIKDLQKKLNG